MNNRIRTLGGIGAGLWIACLPILAMAQVRVADERP